MRVDLHNGDCLELMKDIPDGSVDLVLTDPPYGTMKGIDDRHNWDTILDTQTMFMEISRVLRQNGKAALFAQEPYTSDLIKHTIPSLPFSYRAIWLKNCAGNSLMAKSAMVSKYEDICIFSKIIEEDKANNPTLETMIEMLARSGKTVKEAIETIGSSATHYFSKGKQFRIPTQEKYEALKANGFFDMNYSVIKSQYDDYNSNNLKARNYKYPSVFNLWQGNKSKSNVLEYAKDNDGFHPTQKPVLLLEDLIKTYSNDGDTVLDFTMGSGSTGVACINTGRNFIGIELDEGYFKIAQERIQAAQEVAT